MASLAVVVLAAVLVVSGAHSDSWASSPAPVDTLPAPEELPADTVAVVGHVPLKLRTITTVELTRAMGYSIVEFGLKSVPAPGQTKYKAVEKAALGELLDSIWIQGQATEMGIAVTKKNVTAELGRIKKESFTSEKQYHAFLKHFHLTQRDALLRVKLQLLSTKIQEHFLSFKGFSKFVDAYVKRWQSRTVCAVQYATKRCSNDPSLQNDAHPSGRQLGAD